MHQVWTVKEAAEYLRRDEREFRRNAVKTGEVKSFNEGERKTLIHYQELARYIARLEQATEKKILEKS